MRSLNIHFYWLRLWSNRIFSWYPEGGQDGILPCLIYQTIRKESTPKLTRILSLHFERESSNGRIFRDGWVISTWSGSELKAKGELREWNSLRRRKTVRRVGFSPRSTYRGFAESRGKAIVGDGKSNVRKCGSAGSSSQEKKMSGFGFQQRLRCAHQSE